MISFLFTSPFVFGTLLFSFWTSQVFGAILPFYHQPTIYDRTIVVYRNGGNNTQCGSEAFVQMTVNTVTEDFAYFKARAGCKLNYIPHDCTEFSFSRPRRPAEELCLPVNASREPSPLCGLTTYTDRIRVYDRNGKMLDNLYFVENDDIFFIVPPGDHFFWPGEYVGRKVTLPDFTLPDGSPIVLETLSLEPRVFFVEQFVTEEERNMIRSAAEPNLIESRGFERGENKKIEARNSYQAWLSCNNETNNFICQLDERIAKTVRIPLKHVEVHSDPLQVIRYEPQQHYHSHHDFFDPTQNPTTPGLREGYNRMITLLWYLNDVEEGGETIFPLGGATAYASEAVTDMTSCNRGLKVKPKAGSAILWYNMLVEGNGHEGRLDRRTLHGGCDVVKGVKWAANKWIYNHKWDQRNWLGTETVGGARLVDMPKQVDYPQDPLAHSSTPKQEGAVMIRIVNELDESLDLFWDGRDFGQNELVMGVVDANGARAFNSFVGHKWAVKHPTTKQLVLGFVVQANVLTYVIPKKTNDRQATRDEL